MSTIFVHQLERDLDCDFVLLINIVVPDCVLHNIFDEKYKSRIPTEFKVLVVLSMLARGHAIDTMEELSHIPRSTCHHLFHTLIMPYSLRDNFANVWMPIRG